MQKFNSWKYGKNRVILHLQVYHVTSWTCDVMREVAEHLILLWAKRRCPPAICCRLNVSQLSQLQHQTRREIKMCCLRCCQSDTGLKIFSWKELSCRNFVRCSEHISSTSAKVHSSRTPWGAHARAAVLQAIDSWLLNQSVAAKQAIASWKSILLVTSRKRPITNEKHASHQNVAELNYSFGDSDIPLYQFTCYFVSLKLSHLSNYFWDRWSLSLQVVFDAGRSISFTGWLQVKLLSLTCVKGCWPPISTDSQWPVTFGHKTDTLNSFIGCLSHHKAYYES